jgi:hypothetical protein
LSWKLNGKCAKDQNLFDFTVRTKKDFFFDREFIKNAKSYCEDCPVIKECLQEGLKPIHYGQIPPGVWGGQSERDRRRYLRNLEKQFLMLTRQMQEQLQDADFRNVS